MASFAHASEVDLEGIAARSDFYNQKIRRRTFRLLDANREVARAGWKLAGVRYMKPVLAGGLYRAGGPGGVKDLELATLNRLCQAGFRNVIYLYGAAFGGERNILCATPDGGSNLLNYKSIEFRVGRKKIMKSIYRNLMSADRGPVLVHCWNGWHATGEISAIALKQFCSYTNEAAIENFRKNTKPGVDLESLEKQIQDYRIDPKLVPPAEVQRLICPS